MAQSPMADLHVPGHQALQLSARSSHEGRLGQPGSDLADPGCRQEAYSCLHLTSTSEGQGIWTFTGSVAFSQASRVQRTVAAFFVPLTFSSTVVGDSHAQSLNQPVV